jgi:hypothetical protein
MFIQASRTVTRRHSINLTFLCLTGLRCFKSAKSRRLWCRLGFVSFRLSGFATFLLTFRHGACPSSFESYEAGVSISLSTGYMRAGHL